MKRLILSVIVGLCVVAGLLWFGEPYVTNWLRLEVERVLTARLGRPSRVRALSLSVFPLSVGVHDVSVGTKSPLLRMADVEVRLWMLDSLAEGRPVLTVRIAGPDVDLSALPEFAAQTAGGGASAPPALPPLRLKGVAVTAAHLRFLMGKTPADLRIAAFRGQLSSGLLRRGLSAAVVVHGVEMRRQAYRATIDEIRADGGMDRGGLFLNSAAITGHGIAASASATTVAHRCAVRATFDPSILGVVVDELSFIGGSAHLDGILRGDVADPQLHGHLTMTQGTLAHRMLGDLDTEVTRKGPVLSFRNLRIAGPAGRASGSVDITIAKTTPLDAALTWQGVNLERVLTLAGAPAPVDNRVEATTDVHGTLDPLQLQVHGAGTLQTPQPVPKEVAHFELQGTVQPHGVDARVQATQQERNHIAARVVVAGAALRGTVSVHAADLAALNALLPRPVRTLATAGHGDASAALGGTLDHPTVSGTLDLAGLTLAGAHVPKVSGDFAIARQTLTTRGVTLATAGGAAALRGVLALDATARNDWQLRLQGLDTDLVLGLVRGFSGHEAPLSGGTLSGTMACRGAWRRAQAQLDVAARGVRVADEPFPAVTLRVTTALPQWTLHLAAQHGARERLTVDGSGAGNTRLQLAIATTPVQLASWRGARRRRLAGTVRLHAQLSGTASRPDGSVQLTGSGLTLGGAHVGGVTLRAAGTRGTWSLQGSALGGALQFGGTLRAEAALPYTFTATWRQPPLAQLLRTEGALQILSSGTLDLHGSLRQMGASSGALRIAQLEIKRDQGRFTAPAPIEIDLEQGRFRITSLVLAAQGSRLAVTGTGSLSGDLALAVQGSGDLVLLELIGPPFNSARGQFTVAAHVEHTVAAGWGLRGQAAVRDVGLDLGLPVAFTDTNGTFALAGSRVQIDTLSGRAGGGDFHVSGSLDLNRGPAVSWTVHDVAFTMPEWLEERISGSGQVRGTWKALTVSGDVEVLNALYDKQIQITDLLPWFKEHIAPAPRIAPPPVVVQLDLHVHAPDGLYVDNNFAKAEMGADLRITGTPDHPMLAGSVEVLNGEVSFRNRVFRLTGGTIDFQDRYRINPVLNLSAESQISTPEAEYTVTAAVSGTADNPRVQFSADDPSLSQNDVLSLVTFGQTLSQAQRLSGGVGAGDVLALLPSAYTGNVKQHLRSLFGVDRFEVEPAYFQDTGAIEPRVTIGRDLTDRLRALASSTFGVDTRRSVQLEYRVTQRISLLGSWEGRTASEAGAFGGDLKFRYEFRKVPFSLFGGGADAGPRHDAP